MGCPFFLLELNGRRQFYCWEQGESVPRLDAAFGEWQSPIVIHEENKKRKHSNALVSDQQFGSKVGKHARDYGLDPSREEDREWMRKHIQSIIDEYDEERIVVWRGVEENGKEGEVVALVKDQDVVLLTKDDTFITILKDGINNSRVKRGEKLE